MTVVSPYPKRIRDVARMPNDAPWVARLRLIGIAEIRGRVAEVMEVRYVDPAWAGGLFRMRHGLFVAAAFRGEPASRVVQASVDQARIALELIMDNYRDGVVAHDWFGVCSEETEDSVPWED